MQAFVRLIRVCPGRCPAGTVLADLPGNYLAWFAREGFPEGELGAKFVIWLQRATWGCILQPIGSAYRS